MLPETAMRDPAKPALVHRIVLALGAGFLAFFLAGLGRALFAAAPDPALVDTDFSNYWIAARLVASGEWRDLFGPQPDYFRHMVEAFGADFRWHNWSYPPHMLLLLWPLSALGYVPAMAVFLVATGLFYAWAAWRFAGEARLLLVAATLPFAAFMVWSAQNGFLTAGLALGGLALRQSRPVAAGILIGILTIKPQLGLLLPILLLAERRYLVIASAAATAILLVLVSMALFGRESWAGYFALVAPYQVEVMRTFQGTFLSMMPTLYGSLRAIGLEADPALVVHLLLGLPVAAAAVAAFFVVPDARWRAVILTLATPLVTPYAFAYDLGMTAAGLGLMAYLCATDLASGRLDRWLLAAAMLVPLATYPLGALGCPVAPAFLAAIFALALMRSGFFARSRAFLRRRSTARTDVRD